MAYKNNRSADFEKVYKLKRKDSGLIRRKMLYCRARLGLTQDDVSKAVGITRGYYANIENGRMDPSVKLTIKIADVLHTHWKDIYDKAYIDGR